jgi:hypothetical protein
MHGGFVLYNGGFNAGLTAIILIPILDFYNIKPKRVDNDEIYPIENYKKDPLMKLIERIDRRIKKLNQK